MDPLKVLTERLKGRSKVDLAAELGISEAYLHDLFNGRREPGPTVLDALGLERKVTYRRKGNGK